MAKYRITGPDGATYEVTAPDTATEAEVLSFAQKNYQGGSATEPKKSGGLVQAAKDTVGGLVRGAGSIGATVVDGARSLADSVSEAVPANMRPEVTQGLKEAPRGKALRSEMDASLRT